MRNRKLLLWSLVGLLVAAIVGVRLAYPPLQINYANYDRVDHGMTLQEVERFLNCPPGDYRSSTDTFVFEPQTRLFMLGEAVREVEWFGDRGRLAVGLDEQDRVVWVRRDGVARLWNWFERLLGRSLSE